MGWQDRDWARVPDDDPHSATRAVVWSVVGVLVLAGSLFAISQRPHTTGPGFGVAPPGPDVIYGQPSEVSGQLGVCTEYEVQASGWMCTVIDLNAGHLRVARAAPYDGPCTHLSVDQTTGRWVCVSARPTGAPPAPAGQNS